MDLCSPKVSLECSNEILLCYQELHDHDGVVLWYCFIQYFAGTTIENLLEAYSQLSETKVQLPFFTMYFYLQIPFKILFIIFSRPINHQVYFLAVFHGYIDAANEESHSFVISLYADHCAGGSAKSLTMQIIVLEDQPNL